MPIYLIKYPLIVRYFVCVSHTSLLYINNYKTFQFNSYATQMKCEIKSLCIVGESASTLYIDLRNTDYLFSV